MSQKFEDLSVLVDGEVEATSSSDNHLIDDVKNDTELMQKWNNYHLIRDGLRKELPVELNFDIAANVAQALESEPAIIAPKKGWGNVPIIGRVIPFAKQGGQMAVAASVAVAMILGVQQLNQADTDTPFNAAPPILGVQGGLSPVSYDQTRALPQTNEVEQRRKVNAYIVDHNQQMRFRTSEQVSNNTASRSQQDSTAEEQVKTVENIPE
ncbi:sigma-E factor negative regulatory protein [Paraglaciecola sp. 2405UD69-4]|uniref:sigma-E factor negative regulatory protein n=1 Tax=Paraglaciecola sp. 2405UD69-4 TaxID=3391836 RepID=UPI0039C9CBA4